MLLIRPARPPRRAPRLQALALLLWCTACGTAVRAHVNCSLELRGSDSGTASLASGSLRCSGVPGNRMSVFYDRGLLPNLPRDTAGVVPVPLAGPREDPSHNVSLPPRPVLYFKGDGRTTLRFAHLNVSNVRLQVNANSIAVVVAFNGLDVVVDGGELRKNKADIIILLYNGSAVLNAVTASNNSATAGVVRVEESELNATRLNCTHNTVLYYGGCITAKWSTITLTHGRFHDNEANEAGAVVAFSSNVTLENCNFTSNRAITGGAVSAVCFPGPQCTLHVRASTFEKNLAGLVTSVPPEQRNRAALARGGALYAESNAAVLRVTIEGTRIANNNATDGGGLACYDCLLNIKSTNFTGNAAERWGGALYVWSGGNVSRSARLAVELARSQFANNNATAAGGALAWLHQSGAVPGSTRMSIKNCRFADNYAMLQGGAIAGLYERTNTSEPAPVTLAPLELQFNNFLTNDAPEGASVHAVSMYELSLLNNTAVVFNGTARVPIDNLSVFDVGVLWRKRDCLRGEEHRLDPATGEAVCALCRPFTYSLTQGSECAPCPPGGTCQGGAVVVSKDGFWHGTCTSSDALCSYTLADVTRCPNFAACHHNVTSLLSVHPLGVGAARSERVNMSTYEARQCTTSSGYEGVLCGSCSAPLFGQTAPFTCKPCLTKPGTSDKLDLAGMNALWIFWWAVNTGLLLVTVADSVTHADTRSDTSVSGVDAKSAAGALPSTPRNRAMRWSEVYKALTVYRDYGMVLFNLPVAWLPFDLHPGDERSPLSQLLGVTSGALAPIDCLLAAYHSPLRDARHAAARAGAKALINLLAIPLVHLASLLVLQLAWWFWGETLLAAARAAGTWVWRWVRHCGRQPAAAPQPLPAARARAGLAAYMRVRATVSLLAVVFKFYPQLVHAALRMFVCVRIGSTSRWVVDVALACPLPVGRAAGGASALALAIGVPALVAVVAWPAAVAGVLCAGARRGRLTADAFRERFGFLYLDYRVSPANFGGRGAAATGPADSAPKPLATLTRAGRCCPRVHVSWNGLDKVLHRRLVLCWDAVVDVQRFALVAVSLAVGLTEHAQVLLLCLALGLYLILILIVRPYTAPALHRLNVAMLGCLCASCLGILAIITAAGGSDMSLRVLGSLVVAANALVLVVAAAMLLVCLQRMWRPALRRLLACLRRCAKRWSSSAPGGGGDAGTGCCC